MAKKLRPLGNRVIVAPMEQEEMTAGGIYVPETAKKKPQEGKVIAVGPGQRQDDGSRTPMDVDEGDLVIYAKYGGTEFKIDDQELLILSEGDILAKVES
ncbi:MAG: 10 kDa chaperonin [Anaerolineales bacterium]|nr:10 kDa chaperonin [Anaerolineales bacterium]